MNLVDLSSIAILVIARSPMAATLAAQVKRQKRQADLDANTISYIRPGIVVKVVSAAIAKDGTITPVSRSPIPRACRSIWTASPPPAPSHCASSRPIFRPGKKQYVSYTTTVLKATLNTNPSQTQAATDSGGTFTKNAEGDYTYTFKTKAPTTFDPTVNPRHRASAPTATSANS